MIRNCLEIRAGEPGDAFLRERLRNGMAMGEQLIRLVDEVPGEVTALLSRRAKPVEGSGLTSERAIRYGAVNSRAKDSLACLVRKVQEFLAHNHDHVCIVEDAMASRQDPGMCSSNLPTLFLDDNVYWYLTSDHTRDVETINSICFVIGDWGSIGIMASRPPGMVGGDRQEITLSTLSQLVAGVQRILVSAYDGEGYLIWYRGKWPGGTRRWGIF